MRSAEARTAFVTSLPVAAGYLLLGFGFGVLLVSKGYPIVLAPLMSVFIYAGAMQYVAVDLLSGGATMIAAALMTLLINARHLFYGLSMLERYRDMGRTKPYLIFAMTDETYSLVCWRPPPEGLDPRRYYFLLSLFNQLYWIVGGALGGLVGGLVPISFRGIDFSMTAMFVVVFLQQWRHSRDHLPALAGLICTLISLLAFGPDNFILPAMVGILLCMSLLRRRVEAGA